LRVVMKPRDASMQLKRFEVQEKRRKVAEIEAMINEFNQMAADLDRQIAIEEERAGVSDTNHYAYPMLAKAAIQRRDNLLASAADLEAKLANVRDNLAEAFEEVKKIELLEDRLKLEQIRVAQAELEILHDTSPGFLD
jgi:flagellar protein FliJ